MRMIRTLHRTGLALSILVGAATLPAQQPRSTRLGPSSGRVTVLAGDDAGLFELDDALLSGIALSGAQRTDVAELRQLQVVEAAAFRPRLLEAVDAMQRAHLRGDDATAREVMAVLQSGLQSQRTWRLAALRALLTPEQRQLFDRNVDELQAPQERAEPRDDAPASP